MIRLLVSYIVWHYTRALAELFLNCRNFISFLYHFFSIGELSHTLFAPWQMLGERYKKGFDPENFFEVFVVNSLMRLVGFLVRGAVILLGVVVIIFTILCSVVAFGFWLVLPLATILFLISGLKIVLTFF